MFTEYHEYAWRTAKQHLDFEIGKVEGQLRNCRSRMDLAKKEMIVCISSVFVPFVIVLVLQTYPAGVADAVVNHLLYALTSVISLILFVAYMFLLPFLVYYMVKAIMFYVLCKKQAKVKEPLKEYSGYDKDISDPEMSYVTEEEKLIRILSKYYDHRIHMEEMKEKLKEDELSMTVEEMQKELDGMVFFQEIIPASPFGGKLVKKAKFLTVIIYVILILIIIY